MCVVWHFCLINDLLIKSTVGWGDKSISMYTVRSSEMLPYQLFPLISGCVKLLCAVLQNYEQSCFCGNTEFVHYFGITVTTYLDLSSAVLGWVSQKQTSTLVILQFRGHSVDVQDYYTIYTNITV